MQCLRCQQAELAYDENSGTMRCPVCGYRLFQDDLELPPEFRPAKPQPQTRPTPPPQVIKPAQAVPANQPPPIPIDLPRMMDWGTLETESAAERIRVRNRCEEALTAIGQGNYERARQALKSALQLVPEYDQAWLFLAGIANNAAEQRDYLEHVLAANPRSLIALEAIARLDGRFEDATNFARQRLDPGQVATQQITCPNCKGRVIYDIDAQEVVCQHCGYRILDARKLSRSGQQTILAVGLLKRKQRAADWNIGGRWIRCANCGATTTLARRTMTNTCRFCGSQQLIQESASYQFEQPDLIAPFQIDETQAREAVDKKLRSGIRMITRFFADAIAHVELQGVYLPFWIFDADLTVKWSWTNAPDHGDHPVLLSDIPYMAAEQPGRKLVRRLEPFNVRQAVDYDPRLLGIHPAELYSIDIDRASLDVRPKLHTLAERQAEPGLRVRKPARGYNYDDDPGQLVMDTMTDNLTYRLGLLPVWIGLLVEEDGDTRQTLVNGQTGKVSLGRVEKHG